VGVVASNRRCGRVDPRGRRAYLYDVAPSSAARLLFRPFRTYDALAQASEEDAPTVLGGVARLLFVIGAFVSLTATGRLAPFELAVAMGSYAYVPLAQLVAVTFAVRAVSRKVSLRRAHAFYLAGHGPWFLMLLGIALVCLIAPSPATVLFAVLPKALPLTFVWSGILTYACFKRGLGLGTRGAGVGVAIYVAALTSIILGYYVAMGQLGPLFKH